MNVKEINFAFDSENLTEKYVLACFFLTQLVNELEPSANITMDKIETSLSHAVQNGNLGEVDIFSQENEAVH